MSIFQTNAVCPVCGDSFTHQRWRPRKFCSRSCANKVNVKNLGEFYGAKQISLTCDQCGESFTRNPFEVAKTKNHFCSRKCFAESIRGEKNPRWKGGYAPYYGPNWYEQRRKARKRDNYTCQHCGVTEQETKRELDIHHIIPFREFGRVRYKEANELSNLLSLCQDCHLKMTQAS